MKRRERILLAVIVALVLPVGSLTLAGCATDQRQTSVIPENPANSGGLTALDRGRIRDEVLAVVRPAMEAWSLSDIAGMKSYFSKDLVGYNAKLKAGYARQGKIRVRRHAKVFMDVTSLNNTGTQAQVSYTFTNKSYFIDKATGGALTKPSNRHGEIDFVIDHQKTGWIITRMFSGKDELL